jgi:hypothetical protein
MTTPRQRAAIAREREARVRDAVYPLWAELFYGQGPMTPALWAMVDECERKAGELVATGEFDDFKPLIKKRVTGARHVPKLRRTPAETRKMREALMAQYQVGEISRRDFNWLYGA